MIHEFIKDNSLWIILLSFLFIPLSNFLWIFATIKIHRNKEVTRVNRGLAIGGLMYLFAILCIGLFFIGEIIGLVGLFL